VTIHSDKSSAMKDQDQLREQLVSENEELRRRVAATEKALQENHSATALLQAAPLAIHACDAKGRITFVNPSQEAITGYTADELVSTYAWDHIEPGPERDALPACFEHLVSEQPAPTPFFAKNIRKSGELFDVRIDWNYKRNPQGQVTGFVCIVSDITEQKRVEEALREGEERYRLLAEAIPHPVWRSDAEGRQIDCNRRWQEYTGQTPEEAQGNGWMKALHPDDVPRAVQRVQEDVPGGKIYQAEYRLRRASDNSYHWHLARAIPRRDADGTILGWFGSAVDIDDQKRAQEALAEREERLLEAQEVASLGFYVLDIAKGSLTSSSVLDQILEIPLDYPRTVEGWGDLLHPDECQAMLDYLKEVIEERKPFDREYRIVRYGDKEVRWVHGLGRLQFDEEGQPIAMFGTIQDITERKRAEEALKKVHDELEEKVKERTAELTKSNEELAIFQKFAEASGQGFSMADLDGHVIYLNPTMCRMLGEERPEDGIGQHLSTYYSEQSNRRGKEEIEPALKQRGYWEGELPMLSRQGKSVPTWHNTFIIRDENGNPMRMAVVVTDITERKRAEEDLAESEAKYRHLVETTDTGYLILDEEGRVVDANVEYVRLTGHQSLSEIMGRRLEEWTASYDAERNSREIQKCMQEGNVRHLEVDYLGPHGKITPIEVNAGVIETTQGSRIISLCRDITERKRAEEALRASTERYELAVRGAGVGIWDWDIRTGKVYYSPRWKRLFGYDENDIGDGVEDWVRLLHPDERDGILKFQDEFLAGTSPTVTVEYRLRHKDGSYRWIVAHALVVRDEQGSACRLVGSHGDITDRKRAEEALDRERQSLWRMLQASDHERQIISYEIHDGLSQYLAAATMQFQAHDALRENSPQEAKKAYETAMELVRQAHAESRRLISEVRPPIIDENGIEMAISHLVHEQRRRGGPQIECHSDVQFGRLPAILENALYRIVQEALSNACQHSKSKKVTVTMAQEGQDVRLEVRDWGIGFSPDSVAKGHFGLESIRQRVRLLGGRLTIETTPGSGTRVQVVVPILEKQIDG